MLDSYDYVVVGAGSAGCVIASRLSVDPAVSVLVIESGPEDTSPFVAMPLGTARLMGIGGSGNPDGPKSHFSFYPISPGGNRPPEQWMKGRAIGGSSSVNGLAYMRGLPADYDRWEATGCTGWGWDTIGRCFREIEHHQLGASANRGGDGPLRVSLARLDGLGKATVAAFGEAGVPLVEDINDLPDISEGGVGAQPGTIWRGRRYSSARAFLHPARGRPNLHVLAETDVLDILFDGLTATGVRIRDRNGVRSVGARREVILSAGALHTPKLLQLSGIGPSGLLRSLGIDVRVDAPDVGRNLQEHRTAVVSYRLKRGGRNPQLHGLGLGMSVLQYILTRRGALTTGFWEVGGLVKTSPELSEPDCQVGVNFITYDATGVDKRPGMSFYGYVMRPRSRGEVSIETGDPSTSLKITANYLSDEYDRRHTVALFRYMRRVAGQPALARHIEAEDIPGASVVEDEDLVDANFRQGASAMHAVGTCRMGADKDAVVDPDLRVRGVNGLRVVDTSVMPTMVSGNPNGPVMALAWHAAERIRAG